MIFDLVICSFAFFKIKNVPKNIKIIFFTGQKSVSDDFVFLQDNLSIVEKQILAIHHIREHFSYRFLMVWVNNTCPTIDIISQYLNDLDENELIYCEILSSFILSESLVKLMDDFGTEGEEIPNLIRKIENIKIHSFKNFNVKDECLKIMSSDVDLNWIGEISNGEILDILDIGTGYKKKIYTIALLLTNKENNLCCLTDDNDYIVLLRKSLPNRVTFYNSNDEVPYNSFNVVISNKSKKLVKKFARDSAIMIVGDDDGSECFKRNRKIVFYTSFFGSDNNKANHIPILPSESYDCLYFTNNRVTIEKLDETGWIGIFVDIPISDDVVQCAFQSKIYKACPHRFSELKKYEYSCYFDTKLKVNDKIVEEQIENMEKDNKLLVMSRHKFLSNVMAEFHEAMCQQRYRKDHDRYWSYIHGMVAKGFRLEMPTHYITGYIVRKHCDEIEKMGEAWYENILECGIECQISFFFIQQMFPDIIYRIEMDHH